MRTGNIARIIIVHGGKVLLVKNRNVKYWHLPGGKQEVGESMIMTARRECKEELGVDPVISHFVACADLMLKFADVHIHENYFLVSNDHDFINANFDDASNAYELDAIQWFDRSELADIPLVPGFLRQALMDLIDKPDELSPLYVYEINNEIQELINV
ncbi:MAG: NUDIX hydrolase [Patescibacteria group bacterium]|nr:NUDIX hydrolase [Patescibacteria group bacterium]